MRILIINSFFDVGGPPRIVKGIYDTLIEKGDDCLVAAARETPIEGMNTVRIGRKNEPYVNALKSRVLDNEGFNAKKATQNFIEAIEAYNPDVVNLHNLHGYFINIEVLFNYLKSSKVPIVWTLHDCWPITGHCTHFDFIKCYRWENEGCHNCPQSREYPASYFADRSKRNFEKKKSLFGGFENMTIVTPSEWLGRLVKRSYLKDYDVRVIHNGIDTSEFLPVESDFKKRYGITDKRIVLGVAQNWKEKKGFEDFIKLNGLLDPIYQIVLVGLTDEQKKALPDGIIGITRTNNVEELVEIYSSAYVFVNCTYQDNFPTVNIEALACGVPVITYDTGGSAEAADAASGIAVKQGDIQQLAKSIEKLDKTKLSMESCRNRALKFDRFNRYEEYYELLHSIGKKGALLK